MNYYRCIFYKGDSPQGKAYTFKSVTDYKAGEIVEVQGHRKAIVVGTIEEKDIDYDLDKIQPIVGEWKESEDELLR